VLPAASGAGGAVVADELPGRDAHQPGQRPLGEVWIAPSLVCLDERLLDGVLGVGEGAGPAGEDGKGLRCKLAQQALDRLRRRVAHPSAASRLRIWRTSIGCRMGPPPAPGAAEIRAAISTARSMVSTSMRR
jgi:hypothetical protein